MSNGSNMIETVSMSNGSNMIETVSTSNSSNMNIAVKTSRKAAKRTLPWDQAAGELLVSQDEDTPARKKLRLEEPLPTTTDEADRKTASPDLSVGLRPPAAAAGDDANTDAVTDTQPNAMATRATARWTTNEDEKLTRAVANTSKKRCGKEYNRAFAAVAALVPGRTPRQCLRRWDTVLDPSIGRTNRRKGKWTSVEERKLKDEVQAHGDKDWVAIAFFIPGRTNNQCRNRWKDVLDPSIDRVNRRGQKTMTSS